MRGEPINETEISAVAARHGCDWLYRHDTGSTNADVLEYYASHAREVIAFSESQQAGRGRRGREWLSPYAGNIYCTIGLTREFPLESQGLLSIVTGLALCRALRRAVGVSVSLKWPNDILFEGSKLGGILIESKPAADGKLFFAVGFGLNVFMNEEELAQIPAPVTSLDRIVTAGLDRTQVLGVSIDSVVESIRAFDVGTVAELISEFDRYDALKGRRVEVILGQKRVSGINRGINSGGQLQLETEQGLEFHSAAEISLRASPE